MKNFWVNLYLFWGMVQDLREKKISLLYLKTGAGVALMFLLWGIGNQGIKIMDILVSCLPGILFLSLAKLTKEKIGEGDGLLFLIIGCCLDSKESWMLWQLSLLLSFLFSFLMLIMKKYKGESQIAFIPFVWFAHVFLWSMKYVTQK